MAICNPGQYRRNKHPNSVPCIAHAPHLAAVITSVTIRNSATPDSDADPQAALAGLRARTCQLID
ncbi:hypothetical protein ColTof4_13097 [Colletotrichum tofieldiae]|nr:hypothetical protein ColTof3_00270 [Colletotrichum tofieldiae]GKT80674.1 hypothetical protein ColTof4_13097 [Colletotrichum tofieldiae]